MTFRAFERGTGVYAETPGSKAAAWEDFPTHPRWSTPPRSSSAPMRGAATDVLVLPPSFPYGGMENPRLTFATPSILGTRPSSSGSH